MTTVKNETFGFRVGCDYTMASKLRNGQRLPSRELLERIVAAFDLDANEALAATAAGPQAFSEYLNDRVFRVKEPAPSDS